MAQDQNAISLFPPLPLSYIPASLANAHDYELVNQVSRKERKLSAPGWKLTSVIGRIADGERAFLHKLTTGQLVEVVSAMADHNTDLEAQIEQMAEEKDDLLRRHAARAKRNLRRDFTMEQIMEKSNEKQQVNAAISPRSPGASTAAQEPSPGKKTVVSTPTLLKQASSLTSRQEEEEKTAAPSGWRSMLSSVGSYIPIPFARKRRPDGDVVEPSQKRARLGESEMEPDSTPLLPPAGDATQQPSQKRKRAGSPARTPGPSTRIPGTVTSLSTISERTERSTLSDVPENTPASSAAGFPWGPRSQIIHSTPTQAPRPRSVAEMRAAAERRRNKTPSTNSFSWSGRGSTPLPKLPNADERYEKLQRLNRLESQLEELKKDEDIIEMQKLRRKRVKIDNLPVIPHNLPGDPDSTFRVPEYDSDEEMEVLYDVPEEENSFQSNEEEDERELEQTPTPTPTFAFPDVGPRPANYEASETYKKTAENDFATGFQKYVYTETAEQAFATGFQAYVASL